MSSAAASLTSLKCLLNKIVSEHALFATIDLTDFYLGALLPEAEFIKISVNHYDTSLLQSLNLTPYVQVDKKGIKNIYFEIVNMDGLPSSGKLSRDRLAAHLLTAGYHETTTPGYFHHATRKISFCLVVDDFGICYHRTADLNHLINALSDIFHVKVHPTGTKFLGLAVYHNRSTRTIALSYPGFIKALLTRVRSDGIKPADTPAIYTPPSYGRKGPQPATQLPPPAPASEDEVSQLRTIVGSLLYYSLAIDSTILPAVCALACQEACATEHLLKAADRLLGPATKWLIGRPPDGCLLRYRMANQSGG